MLKDFYKFLCVNCPLNFLQIKIADLIETNVKNENTSLTIRSCEDFSSINLEKKKLHKK